MTRPQIQQLTVIVLLLVFGGVWIMTRKQTLPILRSALPAARPFGRTPPEAEAPPAPSPPKGPTAPAGEPALVRDVFQMPSLLFQRLQEKELERQRAERKTEPHEPSGPMPMELPELQLQGIFWGTPKPQALINRRILSVGDRIGEATVLSIDQNRVTLSYHGQQVVLEPPPPIRPGSSREESGGWSGGRSEPYVP